MPYKVRTESALLKSLRILNSRMNLSAEEKKYYLNLEKGYQGEVQFDVLTEKLQSNCYILNDLQLETNNKYFQIDTSIIFEKLIYLFEIKNLESDYFYDPDIFYTHSGLEVQNPLDQLKRCKILLRQLLQKHGINIPIEAYVIFINPQFTLYQTPPNLPYVFPTQINSFMKRLNTTSSQLNNYHKNLADKLVSLHKPHPAFNKLPNYDMTQMKGGLSCVKCNSILTFVKGQKLTCSQCCCEEKLELAVIRNVENFKLLFPDRKITTNLMFEWCKIIDSKKRISRILSKNYEISGVHQWAFYK
jgi:hypothetical protein